MRHAVANRADSGTAGPQPALAVSGPGSFWNTAQSYSVIAMGTADVTVNDRTPMQSWEGFGGAFRAAGWSYLQELTTADQNSALQLLFGTEGAHLTIGRIPIGASDYALTRYTEDEVANDTSMANFSIARDNSYLIP